MASEQSFLGMLTASGAFKEGHFLLSSGRHSDRYVEKFDLLRLPSATSAACAMVANQFRDREIDVVAGPTTGGVILAFETARQLNVKSAYAERKSEGGTAREFRRGTSFSPGSRVLVVDDILTTGGSVRETLDALAGFPVRVVAVAVLVDRSSGSMDFGVQLVSLARMNITTWDTETCPLCRDGIALTKPGTTSSVAPRSQ